MAFKAARFGDLYRACTAGSPAALAAHLDACLPHFESFDIFESTLRVGTTAAGATGRAGGEQQLAQALNVGVEDAHDLFRLALRQGHPTSAESAAYCFFEERRHLLMCLVFFLQVFLDYRSAPDATVQHATTLLRHLVATSGPGRPAILASLCTIAQKATERQLSGVVTHVVDRFGGRARLEAVTAHEGVLACEAAFLLCSARSTIRATPTESGALVSLLNSLCASGGAKFAFGGDYVLAALVMVLAPRWPSEASASDDAALAALVRAPDVLRAVQSLPKDAGNLGGVARLALGMAIIAQYDKADTDEVATALRLVAEAIEASAFTCLDMLAKSANFSRHSGDARARIAAVLLELTLRYAESVANLGPHDDPARYRSANVFDSPLRTVRGARTTSTGRAYSLSPLPGTAPGHGSGTLVASGTAAPASPDRDTPTTLLRAVSSLLAAHVAAHDGGTTFTADVPQAAQDAFAGFLSFACKAPPLVEDCDAEGDGARPGWGSSARAAYLDVLRAYACSPKAASQIVSQLALHAQHDEYEHISWQEYFRLVSGLHGRYLQTAADPSLQMHDERRRPASAEERIVSVAYTDLLAAILTALKPEPAAELRSKAIACLEKEFQAACPNHRAHGPEELLLQVMCLPVPHEIKASVDGYLAATAATPAAAVQLLRRLQPAEIVSTGAAVNLPMQLKAVAESAEEYSEMVAYVRLVNAILEAVGPAHVKEEALHVLPFTEFITGHLLAGLSARRYSNAEQQYLLAEVCLQHMSICIAYMRDADAPPDGHPGMCVLSHLLSPAGTLLPEIVMHVIGVSATMQPNAVERLAGLLDSSSVGLAAERAVLAAFALLNSVFDVDMHWVASRRQQQQAVKPLHSIIAAEPAWTLQLAQFVQPGTSEELLAAAARVVGYMSSRDSTFTHTLQRFPQPARKLVHDYAACIGDVATQTPTGDRGEEALAAVGTLLLQVLLENVNRPFPNFTQLMLGYAVHQDEDALERGPTRHGPSCLTALLPLLQLTDVPGGLRRTYTAAWVLMHRATQARWDGDALLRRLTVDGIVSCALLSSLWTQHEQESGQDALLCKACVLQIVALVLLVHGGLGDDPTLDTAIAHLVSALLLGSVRRRDNGDSEGHSQAEGILLAALAQLDAFRSCSLADMFPRSKVSSDALQALRLTNVLDSTLSVDEGGVLVLDSVQGVWQYEGSMVLHQLQTGMFEAAKKLEPCAPADIDAAITASLSFVAQWNVLQLRVSCFCQLVKAWQALAVLVLSKHSRLCAQTLATLPEQGSEALAVVRQTLIRAALFAATHVAQQELRSSAVGLHLQSGSSILLPLLRGVQGLLDHLAAEQDMVPRITATFCHETVVVLLTLSQTVSENSALMNCRGEILMKIHACLLTHFGVARVHAMGAESFVPAHPSATDHTQNGRRMLQASAAHYASQVDEAHADAINADDRGVAFVSQLLPILAPHPGVSDLPSSSLDTTATLARGDQHIMALHAITALLAADASSILAMRTRDMGVLTAVLESLGSLTEQRLLAPVQFQLQNFRLVEAHLVFLQAFAVPNNASLSVPACRELVDRDVLPVLRQSRILQLHVTPSSSEPTSVATRTTRLRAAALQLLVTIGLLLRDNRATLQELATLICTDASGCLGPRAQQMLAVAASHGTHHVHPLDMRQAEALVFCISIVAKALDGLDVQLGFGPGLLTLRNACIDLLRGICRHSCMSHSPWRQQWATTLNGRQSSEEHSRAIVVRALKPEATALSGDATAGNILPVRLTMCCLDVLSNATTSASDPVCIWPSSDSVSHVGHSAGFEVELLFDLLTCLLKEMRGVHSAFSAADLRQPLPMNTGPSNGAGSYRNGLAVGQPENERSTRATRRLHKHSYSCSVLANKSLALIADCIKEVALHFKTKREQDVSEADRAMLQCLLQRCAALEEQWGAEVSNGDVNLVELMRAIKDRAMHLRDLCNARSEAGHA